MSIPNRINFHPDPNKNKWIRAFEEEMMRLWYKLATLVNGNIKMSNENMSVVTVAVADTGSADTDFTVTHNLKRTPTGYFVIKTDKACNVYTGATAWTATAIYLKSDVANCAITVMVI